MPSKLQFYQSVSEQAAKEITNNRGNWTNFLDTAAKMYKYTFPDQLLIHAQRPDAIACAPIETWNDTFNRWVRRGSKGIALIDDTGSYPKLKYVFDVNDTEASLYNSRPVHLWEMRQEHREPVLAELGKIYDDVDETLADSFHNIARQLAHEYYGDNAREIRYCAEESFIGELDDLNLGVAFENALTNSIAYTLMSRCGFDTAEYFEDEDFQYIFDFNTPDMVHALGTATNELSAQVLRDIELVIKKYERQHAAERSVTNERESDIHASRGLSSAGHQTERAAEGTDRTARTVRENEESVSQRPQDNTVQFNASERNAVSAPSGNGGIGENEVGASYEAVDGREPVTRQGEQPDGLDGGNERLESASGGNGLERTDLHGLENQEKGAADETAPFSVEEQAQIHSDWHKRFVDAVLADEAVIDMAAVGDKDNTITAIRTVVDHICLGIINEISDSTIILNKMEMFTELENYFADKKPNLETYIYDTVVNADSNKEQLAENKQITEQAEINTLPEHGGVFNVNETLSQVGTRAGRSAESAELLAQASRLAEAITDSSVTVAEVDSILRDGGNDKNSVLRIAAHFAKGLTLVENADFLRFEYLRGQWGHNESPGGKGYQFGAQKTAVWFDETGISIGRGKSAIYASDRAHLTWEQAAERVKALYDAGQYVSHDVLDEALYNESVERANDIIEVYQNISRGLSDIQYDLKQAMTQEQKEALKDDWKIRRYLINGLSELSDRAAEIENVENEVTPDEVMQLYNETLRISEPIPPEWGFDKGHPDMVKQITELLRDKGIVSESDINQGIGYNELSEYNLILTRLREDIAELKNEPDAPIRFYRNPHRILSNLEKAGIPPKGFPVADYQPVNFMRFITDDEVDAYLTKGSNFSEGKYRILSHFLQEHTPKERQEFLKNEYGHGGGTWIGDGWHNSEPGKGITLSRGSIFKPYSEVNLNWNQAVRKTQELIQSGRYMSRPELEKIPDYERIILARQINNFYHNLPEDEYERPFDKSLDFFYPKEDEWEAINDFLGDTEQIDGTLAQMQYIFLNTPEEDRYYNLRSEGFHNLSAFREGTYTLFPGIEKLPDPERAIMRTTSETQSQRTTLDFSKPLAESSQLSLFELDNFTILPSVEEQQTKIEQKVEQIPTAEATAPAVSFPITQDEIDELLLSVDNEDITRLAAQFADNPRSKEAVRLVREIYSDFEHNMPRLDAENGYLDISGTNNGVTIARGASAFIPLEERPDDETLTLTWAAVMKRISELAEDGKLAITEHEPTLYEEYQQIKAKYPDSVVFFQVGEFFELYNEDAEIAAQELDITVISRDVGLSEPVRMAGIPLDVMPDYIDKIYEAGYSITLSSLNTDGNRSNLNIPVEDSGKTTEITAEADSAETAAPPTYYSPQKNIPYREGNAVEGLIAHSMNFLVITKIDSDYVYCNFLHSTQEPLATRRNVFDIYLDKGEIHIAEPDMGRTVDTSIESDPPPKWNEYYMFSPEQREAYSREYSAWLERNTPPVERFMVYEIPSRAGVYAVWDNENKRFYEDENGNISTFTDKTEADSYRDTLYANNERTINATEPEKAEGAETKPPYNIGDRLEYNGKPHEIDQIGDFIRLHNLGTPSPYPIFDYVSVLKQNFDRMLADGEIVIADNQKIADKPVELDFDTAAQIIYERVMHNKEFADFLQKALNRGSLRNRINVAFDLIFTEEMEKGDPQNLRPYFADDDFNDMLFSFVYQKAWESRQQREVETVIQTEQATKPTSEKLLSQDGTDFYLFHFPEANETPAALSVETLSLITEKADKYTICADVCYLSEEDMSGWSVAFRKMPRDFGLLPENVQEKIAELRPDLAEAGLKTQIFDELLARGYAVSDELIDDGISDHRGRGGKDNFKDIADYIEAAALTEEAEQENESNIPIVETAQGTPKPLMITPPPVFFVNWEKAQFDFNLNFYNDHDIVGYDKNGVEYAIGRSGSLTYVTSTGAFWGTNEVPGNIYEQITAYENGEVSDEQVRENYISTLEVFNNYRAADLEKTSAELIEVLENGIIAASEKSTISRLLENGISNADLSTMLSAAYTSESSAALSLKNGDKADFKATSQGVEIVVPDKLHNVSAWSMIAPIVRSLAHKWANEPENERTVAEQETADNRRYAVQGDTVYYRNKPYTVDSIDDFGVRLYDPSIAFPVKIHLFSREFDEILTRDPRNAHFLPLQQEVLSQQKDTSSEIITEVTTEKPQEPVKPRPSVIVESILSPGAEVNQIYADYEAIKNGRIKHEVIALESYQERHTAKGVDALLLRDLLAGDGDPRFIAGGAFYERPRDGIAFPAFVVYDFELVRQTIIEAGYLLEIDGKIEKPVDKQTVIPAGVNFRITDDHLGEGSAKTKFRNNINAINTLHDIEFDKRAATPEEQEILSRYIGWGGLPQAFDPDNKQWTNEYLELNAALSPEEFESARASTLNAHYTSPTVIKAMYEAIERMGFKSGNVLEPSCGVGNFFGLLPESMKQSRLYGVELDSVTARIAKQLYPKANIKETGYEKTDTPDAFFDLAIGNVPFGNYGIVDKRYEKHKFHIHDYFFAKTLDQVRPGGVIAFITSKYTLDKQNPDIRKYIAQRAELLGAVRMPNNAFLKNAGTETTMDIIFLQKRDRPIDIVPDWVHLGLTEDGIPVNRYFLDNPEMLLGKMALDEHMNNKYGSDKVTCCLPIEGADLAEQLKTALLNIQGQYTIEELDDIEGIDNHAIPADPNVKNFSYTEVDNTVYFRENSLMYPVELPATTLERIKGMIHLRDCVHELIALQLEDYGEDEIKAKQAELSVMYDRFTAQYGLINTQGNNRAFSADNAYYLLCSLEIIDEEGKLERKADMFTKRTIKQRTVITHVDTASEALAVSLGERACVDMDYMSELTGFTPDKIIKDLDGVIFFDFGNPNRSLPNFDPEKMKLYEKFPLVTADEYLSGNVREKLAKAIRFNETVGDEFYGIDTTVNIKALEAAQPKDLDASEISVRLGSTWIAPDYVQQFMYELLNTTPRNRETYQVKYHQITGEWQVTGKNRVQYSDIHVTMTYGTSRMNAYQIIDDTLNLRDVRVYDYKTDADGKEKRELNKKETTLAQQKQEQIKQAFKDWIWKDPHRRQTLVKEYNEKFNSVRPREYDGSHLTFSGISPEITMRPHQLNAIAHNIYGGNTLLAHVVGAGKTFEMVGIAMESKRLGLCNKSLLAVPNHLTEQWAGEFLRLYPSANILVATKKDFEMRNRKKFCAKIATGDYDAVIIGHSQLEKIPMSRERQERLLNEQLWEVEEGIRELKDSNGERFSIKQLEKTKKSLEARLAKLLDGKKRDDVVTFEQLGVDRLFVDEAHGFKNLFLYTKMRNVAGLSTSEAQKSSDLFMKCRYMDELTDGKGIIFATGTPISNSMTEMYTVQRYLQYDTLAAKGLLHFDCWASIFGETQTSIELAPEGTGYRARTRFAQFHNLPELMSMFKEVADIQTADMLKLPVPEAKFENIIVEPSETQKEMVQELSKRAAKVHARLVEPHVDNMLKITTDGRKIGLDQRLIDPLLPDFEGSKVNACTDNVFRIWEETKDARLTQLVFSDFSTPNKDGRFNIYDDIRAKLIERGIPEHEIAFIHEADTETKKKELFAKVRQGKVRVLLGSTFKMGAGTNVQDRLIATHDVDCPWRPADLEQRAGRIIRQGNQNDEVQIYRYATNGTFDSYLWQTVENKQKFIAQIMSSKSPVRSCEDVDETALSYAEIKALCAGNPLIAEKMNLDVEVAKLRMLKADHQSQRYRLEDDLLKRYPEQITSVTERIAGIEKDIAIYTVQNEKTMQLQEGLNGTVSATAVFPGMTINGEKYTEKEPAAKALLESCKGIADKKEQAIGEYMGFKMSLRMESMTLDKKFNLLLRGNMTYQLELGTDAFGNITRINNLLHELPKRLEGAKEQLESLLSQQEAAKQELQKPFALADELAEKEARLALLNADLNIDGNGGFDVTNDTDSRGEGEEELEPDDEYEYEEEYVSKAAYAKSARPPMLETIRSFNADKQPPTPGKKTTEHDI